MKDRKVVVITGPTAVGKSDVAVLVAKKINAEIISADSSQIYKGFDIGTGKITQDEMQGITHHMLDILKFDEDFNVALFKKAAESIIAQVFASNKNVIICGGTGLYINALIEGFKFFNVKRNQHLREKLETLYNEKGVDALFEIFKNLNQEKAKNIDKKNKVRLIRAIEIEIDKNQKESYEKPKFQYITFVLNTDRAILYERINNRVDTMIKQGLENEVEKLIMQGATLKNSSFKSIGYKEFYNYIVDKQGSLNEVSEKIKQTSRKYAKRQLTWFRKTKNAIWIDVKSKESASESILKKINELL